MQLDDKFTEAVSPTHESVNMFYYNQADWKEMGLPELNQIEMNKYIG